MQEKIIKFIPGWMDRAVFYGYEGLDIWLNNVDPEEKIEADYILAHSLGNHFALINWRKNRNAKLILVNPLLLRKKFRSWMFSWMKFSMGEGVGINPRRYPFVFHIFSGIKKARQMFQVDVLEIIDQINKEDICVIRGKKDKYFCTEEVADFVREKNIRLIELDGVGHMWHGKIDEAVKDILKNL
jgi:predicted alpha/beta hydrolase family esterase